jgi:MFS family permease
MTSTSEIGQRTGTSPRVDWNLTRYLTGRAASLVGDQVYFVALAWAALKASGASGVGIALAAATIPRAILLLAGGVFVDRYGAKPIMLGSNMVRAALLGAIAVWVVAHQPSLTVLILIAIAFGAVDGLFYPADNTITAFLSTPDNITRINGLRQVAQQGALLLGGPAGGVILAAGGLALAFTVDTATLVVAIITLAWTRLTHRTVRPSDEAFVAQLLEGLRQTISRPLIFHTVLIITVAAFAFAAPANVGLPALAHYRHWGASGYGILTGSLGAGALAGALLLGAVRKLAHPGITMMGALLLQAVCLGAAADVPSEALATLLIAVAGLGLSIASALAFSLVQINTPPAHLGRVMSVLTLGTAGLAPLAYLITGPLISTLGVGLTFLACAALEAAAAITGLTLTSTRTATL